MREKTHILVTFFSSFKSDSLHYILCAVSSWIFLFLFQAQFNDVLFKGYFRSIWLEKGEKLECKRKSIWVIENWIKINLGMESLSKKGHKIPSHLSCPSFSSFYTFFLPQSQLMYCQTTMSINASFHIK